MPKLRSLFLLASTLIFASLLCSTRAEAKTSRKLSYSYEQIWPTTVRFLRIDEGLKILEKDADTGYVLFELKDEGKRFLGSVEVVRRQDESKRDAVEIILQLNDRPSYMESSILERMLKKIRVELGMPTEAPVEPPEAPADDDSDKPAKGDENASAS